MQARRKVYFQVRRFAVLLKVPNVNHMRSERAEIAYSGVVTVAVHHLALEVFFVVLQLPLNVRELSVKLVLL